MNVNDSAHVLYVDHKGHPAPLSMCYHATASRRLASATERHPPSTLTEVDSAYCPQCLSFHDATSAATLQFCPKASCRFCPICRSVVNVSVEDAECFFKCGLCEWTSRQCLLSVPFSPDESGIVSATELEKASEELLKQWNDRRSQRDGASRDHFNTMLQTLEGMAKEYVKGKRSTVFWLPNSNARRKDGPEAWSVEALEESIQGRKELVSATLSEIVGGQEVQSTSLLVNEELDASLAGAPVEALLLQGGGESPKLIQSLLPLPVPLRPRKSRRCREELAEGRPGILVKPKLNPLEGDTSLRTGHAQWWKKDSSAVQVLPRLRVSIHASDENKHAFLLKVANPTLGKIRMRLAASSYSGEPRWDDVTQTTTRLERFLVDPFTDKRITAELMPGVVKELAPTKMCELEPAEDSFLELGKSTFNDVPDVVAGWDAGGVLFDSKVSADGPSSSLKLIASKNSAAWFELVVLEGSAAHGIDNAVPITMEIEVGNGSWESSLIQPVARESEEERDLVSFNLVIAWENLN